MAKKGVRQHGAQSPRHITTPVMRHESIVSKVAGTKYSSHNFVDVYYSCQLAIFSADPVSDGLFASKPFKIFSECNSSCWGSRPVAMEFTTSNHCSQKLVLPAQRWSLKN